MSKRVILVSDISGSAENVITTDFGIDDKDYEIDLTEKERKDFEEELVLFISHARKIRGVFEPPVKTSRRESRARAVTVRNWARKHYEDAGEDPDHHIGNRGRIPDEIIRQYNQSPEGQMNPCPLPRRKRST